MCFTSVNFFFSGIFVIISKNPIVSGLFLIGLFLNIAAYLMLLGINFIGLSYLLVLIGAISLVFLLIIILISLKISETDIANNIFAFFTSLLSMKYIILLFTHFTVRSHISSYLEGLDLPYCLLILLSLINNIFVSYIIYKVFNETEYNFFFYILYIYCYMSVNNFNQRWLCV